MLGSVFALEGKHVGEFLLLVTYNPPALAFRSGILLENAQPGSGRTPQQVA